MYHLFTGHTYYPSRGLGDYRGSYLHLDDAILNANYSLENSSQDWAVIIQEQGGILVEVWDNEL